MENADYSYDTAEAQAEGGTSNHTNKEKRNEKKGNMKYNYVSVSPDRNRESNSPTMERIKNIQNLGKFQF
jgi:hypothetical protein